MAAALRSASVLRAAPLQVNTRSDHGLGILRTAFQSVQLATYTPNNACRPQLPALGALLLLIRLPVASTLQSFTNAAVHMQARRVGCAPAVRGLRPMVAVRSVAVKAPEVADYTVEERVGAAAATYGDMTASIKPRNHCFDAICRTHCAASGCYCRVVDNGDSTRRCTYM